MDNFAEHVAETIKQIRAAALNAEVSFVVMFHLGDQPWDTEDNALLPGWQVQAFAGDGP